jgi:hypothetical protein
MSRRRGDKQYGRIAAAVSGLAPAGVLAPWGAGVVLRSQRMQEVVVDGGTLLYVPPG